MQARHWYRALILAVIAASGCGDQVVADTPEAIYTKTNAETLLRRGTDGATREGPGRAVSDDLTSIDCSGGEKAGARGDFSCHAVSEDGWRIGCEGQVTNGRVPSGGCSFLPRD